MTKYQNIYEKYRLGDPLTDAEINSGIIFFSALANHLSMVGPIFELPTRELRRVRDGLEQYREARSNR